MKRRLALFAAGLVVMAGAALDTPASADDGTDDDWVCIGIAPPVDRGLCPGNPFVLLPNPLVPALPGA